MSSPLLTIAPQVAQAVPAARLVALTFEDVTVRERDDALWAKMQREVVRVAAQYPDGNYSGDETLQAVRRFYHRLGVDPTRWRPASEALVRRVVRGKGLYRVNNAVDIVNWCSLASRLPFGLYDRARVQGTVLFRMGETGETYEGIRRDEQRAEGKPVLADDLGVIGSPTADSARTMVRLETRELLVVIYGPAEVAEAALKQATEQTRGRLARWCGAQVVAEEFTRVSLRDATGTAE